MDAIIPPPPSTSGEATIQQALFVRSTAGSSWRMRLSRFARLVARGPGDQVQEAQQLQVPPPMQASPPPQAPPQPPPQAPQQALPPPQLPPQPEEVSEPPQAKAETTAAQTGSTFPADEIVWGVAIRHGFDEIDDPWHHKGVTQHAYLEGNDAVSLCGFRPPQSGPRSRRRARLGLPAATDNPMCGSCARMVVAPRQRVSIPVLSARPAVGVPVTSGASGGAQTRAVVPRVAIPVEGEGSGSSDGLLSRGVKVTTSD